MLCTKVSFLLQWHLSQEAHAPVTASRGGGTKEKKTLNLHDFLWAALCCHALGFCPGADTPGAELSGEADHRDLRWQLGGLLCSVRDSTLQAWLRETLQPPCCGACSPWNGKNHRSPHISLFTWAARKPLTKAHFKMSEMLQLLPRPQKRVHHEVKSAPTF